MPTYEYKCDSCGHTFERWQEMREKKLRTCPACRKPKLVRLIGAGGGLIFRGSGFYETDYKRKSGGGTDAGSKAPAEKDGAPAASGSGESSSGGSSSKDSPASKEGAAPKPAPKESPGPKKAPKRSE